MSVSDALERITADERGMATAAQRLDAAHQIVSLLENFHQDDLNQILEISKDLMRPSYDPHQRIMRLIEVIKIGRQSVADHHDSIGDEDAREADFELWETFGISFERPDRAQESFIGGSDDD